MPVPGTVTVAAAAAEVRELELDAKSGGRRRGGRGRGHSAELLGVTVGTVTVLAASLTEPHAMMPAAA